MMRKSGSDEGVGWKGEKERVQVLKFMTYSIEGFRLLGNLHIFMTECKNNQLLLQAHF